MYSSVYRHGAWYSSTTGYSRMLPFVSTSTYTKFSSSTKFSTVELTRTKLAHQARAAVARGIS